MISSRSFFSSKKRKECFFSLPFYYCIVPVFFRSVVLRIFSEVHSLIDIIKQRSLINTIDQCWLKSGFISRIIILSVRRNRWMNISLSFSLARRFPTTRAIGDISGTKRRKSDATKISIDWTAAVHRRMRLASIWKRKSGPIAKVPTRRVAIRSWDVDFC